MATAAAEKLNKDLRFLRLPEEVNNITRNGKHLTATQRMLYGQVYTENKMFGDYAKTTYADCNEFGVSGSSCARGLSSLVEDGILEKGDRRSKYSIKSETETEADDEESEVEKNKNYIPIYFFLLNAEIEIDNGRRKNHGKVKRIRYNGVQVLCYLIRHYLNPKREEGRVFSGGEEWIAKKFGISLSTACEIINELCSARLNGKRIFLRQMVYEDDRGNQVKVEGRIGSSSKYKTAYIIPEWLTDECKKIDKLLKKRREQIKAEKARREAEATKAREANAEFTQHGDFKEREKQSEDRTSSRRSRRYKQSRERGSVIEECFKGFARARKRDEADGQGNGEVDYNYNPPSQPPPMREWKSEEQKCGAIGKAFKGDDQYERLKAKLFKAHNDMVAAIMAGDSSEEFEAAELEADNELRAFLLNHGVNPDGLPKKFLSRDM